MKCAKCNLIEVGEPEFCCTGWECGCMGLPINPPVCTDCWDKDFGSNKTVRAMKIKLTEESK